MLSNEVVGDKDERGKALSVNVERDGGIFCKIIIVCFLSVRYRLDGLYYKMAGTPSSPTWFFIRVEMIGLRAKVHASIDLVDWYIYRVIKLVPQVQVGFNLIW